MLDIVVLGILASVVGGAILEGAKLMRLRQLEARGQLTGWWWQVTYPPEDPEMLLEPWSVELVEVRHERRNVRVLMHRVMNRANVERQVFNKRWCGAGRYDDIVIDGHYWGDRGHAGHGTFHLWRISATELRGEFTESKSQSAGMTLTFVWNGAPLRWIRVGAEEEEPILGMLKSSPPPQSNNLYPRAVRKQIARVFVGGDRPTK